MVARKEKLLPVRSGPRWPRVIEQGSRMVEDSQKLSILMQGLTDLLKESDYWAGKNGS